MPVHSPPTSVSLLRRVLHTLIDAALPQTCVSCGTWIPGDTGLICSECSAAIDAAQDTPACPRCGRSLPQTAIHGHGCARCRSEHFWNISELVRVGRYDNQLRPLLLDLKYRGRERNAEHLADRLAAMLAQRGWVADLDGLVPVPMHWLRRWQRPCDHARVLADAVGRRLGIPTLTAVRRRRYGRSQTRLTTRHERFDNVRGCFDGIPQADRLVRGKTVCIIDNLLMTGATVCELSKILRHFGAKRIYAAVIGRPPTPGDPVAEPTD